MARPDSRLRVTSGSLRGATFPVVDGLTIGRGPHADIMILAVGVAPRHAQVRRRPGAPDTLVDLGGTTGTWSVGRRVDELELHEGTTFEIAGNRFVHTAVPAVSGAYSMHRAAEPIDRTTIRTGGRLVLGPIPRAVYSGDLVEDVAAVREAWRCAARGERPRGAMTSRELAQLVDRLAVGYDGARPRFAQFVADVAGSLSWSGHGLGTPVTVERLGAEGAAIRCEIDTLAPGQRVWLELECRTRAGTCVRFAGQIGAMTERGATIAFAPGDVLSDAGDTLRASAPTERNLPVAA
jgi:hypothetical protein